MEKFFSLALSTMLAFTLAACGGGGKEAGSPATGASTPAASADTAVTFPTKPINLIISYAAGGGTDVGARMLTPYVEKELGVPINVINKPGGGGWIGWSELAHAAADGYTIGYINSPNFMTGYLDPKQNRKENLDSFAPLANHITDPGAIAIRTDENRFTNIKELIEYAKNNELTATSTGVGSDDHYAILKLNKKFGTKFTAVQNKGSAESQTAVMGGHVDILFANVGELTTLHKGGQIKVIAVMSENRSPFLPDVPTLKESGYDGVFSASSRGIAAPKGVDPKILEILRAALEKGIKNEEQVKKQGEAGLQVDYKDGEDYVQMLKNDEKGIIELRDLMGW